MSTSARARVRDRERGSVEGVRDRGGWVSHAYTHTRIYAGSARDGARPRGDVDTAGGDVGSRSRTRGEGRRRAGGSAGHGAGGHGARSGKREAVAGQRPARDGRKEEKRRAETGESESQVGDARPGRIVVGSSRINENGNEAKQAVECDPQGTEARKRTRTRTTHEARDMIGESKRKRN